MVVNTGNGPDTYTNYVVNRRGKRKDYFTSALSWTQKINDGTVVNIGLGGTAPVITNTLIFKLIMLLLLIVIWFLLLLLLIPVPLLPVIFVSVLTLV